MNSVGFFSWIKTSGILLIAFLVFSCMGCGSENWRESYKGIGSWKFEETTSKQFGGLCEPSKEGYTFCQGSPLQKAHSLSVGTEQQAKVSAYFRGVKDGGKLIELELRVAKCKSNDLMKWALSTFGKPDVRADHGLYWQGKYVNIFARPSGKVDGCRVNYVSSKDQARIDSLRKKIN